MAYKPVTKLIREGLNSDKQYGCVVPPLYPSTTYTFADYGEPRAHDYSRRGNPTRDMAQHAIAELEGGSGAVLTSSGMSAVHLVCQTLLQANDLILAPHNCYGGTYRLLDSLQQKGIYRTIFVDQANAEELDAALAQKPKLVFIETPSNPLLQVVDIAEISHKAHQAGALVVVDNTFLTPIFQQPFQLGADFIVHSCTKYLNGHSDLVAGIVIAKAQQDYEQLAWWANNLGVTTSAFDGYFLLRGLKTLTVRLEHQQRTAHAIAEFLSQHANEKNSCVKKVYYPGLSSHNSYNVARKQQTGFGAMLSFELAGDQETVRQFLHALTLFTLAESLGGVETLISHAATMTHAGMSAEARKQAGISESLLRISVGLEDEHDLIADLQHAFEKVSSL